MKKTFIALSVIAAFILLLSLTPGSNPEAYQHTPEELAFFANNHSMRTPLVPGQWYLTSASCRGCHGHDTLGLTNIDEDGNDVNLVSHWESSMMALSAKDPFWRAKVNHEILVNPAHEGLLQDQCTSCHAPTGRYNHFYRGLGDYRLTDVINDSLGLDGVNCAGCHTIGPSVGNTFSGIIPYDTTRNIYGPFTNPFFGPMQLYEGYTPTYGVHMEESRMCSSCHTLIAQTVDLSGAPTGQQFFEQATYHEFLNSNFPANNIKCQTCHMPQLPTPVVIANGFTALQPRYPFNQHVFAGANHFMLNLIKDNKTSLGVEVADARFDSTIQATSANLKLNSVQLNLMVDSTSNDTAYFRVRIENKVGHKFPSGYPARRVVLQMLVLEGVDTIFRSGTFDSNYRVEGENPAFEPHHSTIVQSNVPQIYEMVMGDVNGNFTSVLERAAILLKDNRLPPVGFTTTHSAYDTVMISADANADIDFNKSGMLEGTGVDFVNFHVAVNGNYSGPIKIITSVFYQAVPPKWLDEMFSYSQNAIDSFKTMYNASDKTPFLVASDSIQTTITGINKKNLENDISIFPTLTTDGNINVEWKSGLEVKKVEIFDQNGKKILETNDIDSSLNHLKLTISGNEGNYYIRIATSTNTIVRKVIKL